MSLLNPPLPISESYWVLPGHFLAGEYPGQYTGELTRKRIDAFLDANITAFIDLTSAGEQVPYEHLLREEAGYYDLPVTYQRFPIGDFGLPTAAEMQATLDSIDLALADGHNVYLHCWGGIGRTGTTVGCYLVRHGMRGDQALAQLTEWWRGVPKSYLHPTSPETPAQHDFVRHWSG